MTTSQMTDSTSDSVPRVRPEQDTTEVSTVGRRALMLGMATVGFAVNFWAWALLSPLGPLFKDSLALSSFSRRCWWRFRWSWDRWGGSRWGR